MIVTKNMFTMMNLFCVFLLVLPLVSQRPLNGTPMQLPKECPFDVPPFLEQSRTGYFQERLNLNAASTPKGYAADKKNPLMEWTCEQNRTWSYPYSPKKIYSLPDVIESIEFVPAVTLNFTTRTFTSLMQVKQEIGRQAGLDPFGEDPGMSILARQYLGLFESMISDKKTITEKKANVGEVRVKFNQSAITPALKLQKEIDEFKRTLNQTYFENPQFYNSLLRNYGSLMVVDSVFASLVWQVSVIEPTYLANHTWQQVEENVMRSLKNVVGDWFDEAVQVSESHNKPVDKEFQEKSQIYTCSQSSIYSKPSYGTSGIGCDDALLRRGYDGWFPTAVLNPFIVEGKFKPIETLFENDVFIFENLKKARLTRMMRFHIKERIRTLSQQQKANAKFPLTETEQKALFKINLLNGIHFDASRHDGEKHFELLQMNYNEVIKIDAKVQLRLVREKLQKYESSIFNCKLHIFRSRYIRLPAVIEMIDRITHQLLTYTKEVDRLLALSDSELVPRQALLLSMEIDTFTFMESNTQVDLCEHDDWCCTHELVTDLRYLFERMDTYSDEYKQYACMGEGHEHTLMIVSVLPYFKENPIPIPNADKCQTSSTAQYG